QKRWDWYVDDFSARLKPGAKRILMNTRWHEEDVAGRVLEQIERKLIKGRVISIPAIAEENDPLGRKPGEYLWDEPEGYNYRAFLRDRRRETSPMMWSALYQQRPASMERRGAMNIGYARTSTIEQDASFEAQERQLKAAGCEKVFKEQVSAVAAKREQLE